MQMANHVSSKHTNIFLAVEGSDRPQSPGGSAASGRVPSVVERTSGSGDQALERGWHVVTVKYFTELLRDGTSQSGFRSGKALNIVHKGVNKVKGGVQEHLPLPFLFAVCQHSNHIWKGRQRNEATFAESERTWLALAPLQGKEFVVQKQTSQLDLLPHHCKSTDKSSCVL